MPLVTPSQLMRNGLIAVPAELVDGIRKQNEHLHPFLIKGRELSNPDPAYLPYFFMLSETAMDVLLKKIKTVKFIGQHVIGATHYNGHYLYLIFSGLVRVTHDGETRSYSIRECFPNHAEFAVLTSELVSSSTIRLEQCEFSIVKKCEFINWLLTCPDISFGFLGVSEEIAPRELDHAH